MGRKPWTTRSTVGDCCVLDIGVLARGGVFASRTGAPWFRVWNDEKGNEQLRVAYRVASTPERGPALQIGYDLADSYSPTPKPIQYLIETVATPCPFGGQRYWFLCPVVRQGIGCRQRVSKLYLPPGGMVFGCRRCYDLTYLSCRTHDSRVSRLAKNADLLRQALQSDNFRQKMLGMRAYQVLLTRVQKSTRPSL